MHFVSSRISLYYLKFLQNYFCSKNPPTTQEEWMRLLRQQESLHTLEMQKWQKVLHSSVMLLREVTSKSKIIYASVYFYLCLSLCNNFINVLQTEDSLKELQMSIQPRVKHKLTSVIKDLTNSNDRSEFDNS